MLLNIKSSKRRWQYLLLCRIIIPLLFTGFATQKSDAQAVKIVKAEYFWDIDPGQGLGTNIPISSLDSININPTIPVPSFTGYHVLYIRTKKDSMGIISAWGLTDPKTVYVNGIQNLELFWDNDPGLGGGTILTTSLNDSINVSTGIAAPLNSGWHTLYTRRVYYNSAGNVRPASLSEPSQTVLVAVPEKIEYFWDTDPGVGNGLSLSGPGNTIDSINLNYNIPTTGITPGFHKLYIRRNGGGTFQGHTDVRTVKILGLTSGEYFYDTDPGVGSGIPFTLGVPVALPTEIGDTINANYSFLMGCLTPGVHNMYMRMKDGGVWSLTDSIALTVLPDNPILTSKDPGPGPNGSPVKITGSNALAPYYYRLLPGAFQTDSIFLPANGVAAMFEMKDSCGTLRSVTVNTPATPTGYVSTNARGGTDLEAFRYFVYFRDSTNLNNTMIAMKDSGYWLGHVGVNTYFSTAPYATALNSNIFLKRSFRIQTQYNPAGNKTVRLYFSKAEYAALVAADPTSFPNGRSSLTVTKYTGPQEDSLFNPLPGGNSIIIPNSSLLLDSVGVMYTLEFNVTGFSGFYIGGNNSIINICPGTTISIPSNVTGTAYQWQVDNGTGFTNLSNGVNYAGVTTLNLQLINLTTAFNKYKYRCVVTTGGGPVNSQVYTVKFGVSWTGVVSTAWENPANWSCGVLPDASTDVYISSGRPRYPVVNSIQTIRSLTLNPGAIATVASTFKLIITSQ